MLLYEDTVETVLFAGLSLLNNVLEGFVGREAYSTAELGSSLHISANGTTIDQMSLGI
jgi:hypothetical protein